MSICVYIIYIKRNKNHFQAFVRTLFQLNETSVICKYIFEYIAHQSTMYFEHLLTP